MIRAVVGILLLIFNLVLYQNCGGALHSNTVVSASSCDEAMFPTFVAGYYNFFRSQNCKGCHVSGGSGSGAFADADASLAFNEFSVRISPEKVDSKLAVGHQGNNYTALKPQLDGLKNDWDVNKASITCEGDSTNLSAPQSLPIFSSTTNPPSATLTISLDDGNFQPSIPGGKILVDIVAQPKTGSSGTEFYKLSNLRVTSPTTSFQLYGLTVYLNGNQYGVNTYTQIESSITAPVTDLGLDPFGSSAIFVKKDGEEYTDSDFWSVQIESLEIM